MASATSLRSQRRRRMRRRRTRCHRCGHVSISPAHRNTYLSSPHSPYAGRLALYNMSALLGFSRACCVESFLSHHYTFTLTNAYEIVLALDLCLSIISRHGRGSLILLSICVVCYQLRAFVDESQSYSHNSGVCFVSWIASCVQCRFGDQQSRRMRAAPQ